MSQLATSHRQVRITGRNALANRVPEHNFFADWIDGLGQRGWPWKGIQHDGDYQRAHAQPKRVVSHTIQRDSRNAINALRSDFGMVRNISRADSASPPCQRIASLRFR